MAEARHARAGIPAALGLLALLVACTASPRPTQSQSLPPASARATASLGATNVATPSASPPASATPEPPLSLALPGATDPRRVRVTVTPDVPRDGQGKLTVVVASLAADRIDELVLRWPTALRDTLFLAPFAPAEARIVDGGPPLYQEWTKWVDGPGERGEPAGTTSLGWGPLDAGATLTIPIVVTREAPGEVAFDLQILAGEGVLTLEDGTPAELRVDVPY